MVQARTRIMNQLQAVALNEGLRCKKRLWREHGRQQLESFRLAPWASRRRRDLLELLDRLNPTIAELTAIEQEAQKCPPAQGLRSHPGVGALTALGFVLIIGEADRFHCGKQVASYLGLVPLERLWASSFGLPRNRVIRTAGSLSGSNLSGSGLSCAFIGQLFGLTESSCCKGVPTKYDLGKPPLSRFREGFERNDDGRPASLSYKYLLMHLVQGANPCARAMLAVMERIVLRFMMKGHGAR